MLCLRVYEKSKIYNNFGLKKVNLFSNIVVTSKEADKVLTYH